MGLHNVSSSQCHLKIILTVLVMLMTAAVGLSSAPAQAQDIKPDNPEQRLIFEALNQWMGQNTASIEYDPKKLQDPFFPIRDVLRKLEEPKSENWLRPGCCVDLVINQLELVAITIPGDDTGALASFEDSFGNSYVLRQGDSVPLNRRKGHIVEITSSKVTIEEPPRDPSKEPHRTIMMLRTAIPASYQENN